VNVTVNELACRFCQTPLRLTRSVAQGACCCCRLDHEPDEYVDWAVAI